MSLTFGKTWTVGGTPTNPTSVTIGIYDETAASQAKADGTPMDMVATGQFRYSLTTAVPNHSYTATIVVVYDGETYTFTTTATADPSPACACQPSCGSIEEALRENASGALNVTSSAGSVTAHPLDKQILAADRHAAIEARRRGRLGAPLFRVISEGPR